MKKVVFTPGAANRVWQATKIVESNVGEYPERRHFPRLTGGSAVATNDHSWKFKKTSATGGTVTLGQVFLGGAAKTVGSFPSGGTLTGVTTTTHYWVAINRSAATATWGSGASVTANTDTVEYWHVLTLTCAESVITAVMEWWQSDIRVTLFG